MLPDDFLRKMKQAVAEADAFVESKTSHEPVLDDRPSYDFDQTPLPDHEDQRPGLSPDGCPVIGRPAPDLPDDAAYAIEVCREADSRIRSRVQLRLEPEHHIIPKRTRPGD
jgi:hypothetical protein